MKEQWCVIANISGDSAIREGAKVYILILSGDGENVRIAGLGRRNKKVLKWVKRNRLANFRPSLVVNPQEIGNPRTWPTKDEAQAWIDGK